MKIKQNSQLFLPLLPLTILLLTVLACGGSSNNLHSTFDPNFAQTAIAGTSIAAEIQTFTAGTSTNPLIITNSPEQTSTPLSASTIEPTLTLEPHTALKAEIERVLGSGNRNVPRLTTLNFDDPEQGAIFVNWAINDNLTENLIIFGAKSDATDILKALAQSRIDYTYVILSGSFPMVDKFGNSDEKNVVNLTFYKETVERINWENFLSDNIYDIADEAFVWIAFQDK